MTSRRTGRRIAVGALLLSTLPTIVGIAAVRPASATTGAPLGRFNITTNAAAVTSSGSLAAEGGLVITDVGAATVTGTLDSSPSAKSTAVTAEPGTTVRTLLGSSNLPAPPGAAAQYPGGPATSTGSDVGAPADTDTAAATELSAGATASVAGGTGASATESLTANAESSQLAATATSHSGAVTIAGVLDIGSVVGTVSVGYDGTGLHATAGVSVASATVAGIPVDIGSGGVSVGGTPVVPGGTLPTGAPATVADALAKAGISITALGATMTTTATSAYADSGALVIHVTTPDVTSPITGFSSGSDVTLYLGEATATLLDAPATPETAAPTQSSSPSAAATTAPATTAPAVTQPPAATASPGRSAVPGRTVTTVVGGGTAPSTAPPPQLAAAPAAPTAPSSVEAFGYRLSDSSALAGFATWQLLTLGIASTAALVARQRDEGAEDEEEHLCPCP